MFTCDVDSVTVFAQIRNVLFDTAFLKNEEDFINSTHFIGFFFFPGMLSFRLMSKGI